MTAWWKRLFVEPSPPAPAPPAPPREEPPPRPSMFDPTLGARVVDNSEGKLRNAVGSLGGVNMQTLGTSWDDYKPGGQFNPRPGDRANRAQAAMPLPYVPHTTSSPGPNGSSPPVSLPSPASRPQIPLWPVTTDPYGRVVQNWQYPRWVRPTTPLLEIVNNRVLRSLASEDYYATDGVCGPAIDILAEFPLNRGFDASPVYTSNEFPTWFDPSDIPPDSLVDQTGKSTIAVAVSSWLKARCGELEENLNLTYAMIMLQVDGYKHGDGFMNRVDYIPNHDFEVDHTRAYPENTILELQLLNPTAVWLERDIYGQLQKAVIMPPAGSATHAQDLDLARLVHLKHKGTGYTTYGMPITMRVMAELRVKRSYLDAAHAWGQRYAVPIRMLRYGLVVRGGELAGPIATADMAAAAEDAVRDYDPQTGQTIVAPFHWEYLFVGADGSNAMAVSHELMEANRRIMAGLGIPSALLLGDWTNYATARVQFSAMLQRLKLPTDFLTRILVRDVFLPFFTMRGYVDNLGQPIRVEVSWRRGHLEDDQSFMDFVGQAAGIPGFLSLKSLRESIGFDSEVEDQNLDQQVQILARRAALGALPPAGAGLPPGATPPGTNPLNAMPIDPETVGPQQQQLLITRLQDGLTQMTEKLQGLLLKAAATYDAAISEDRLATAAVQTELRGLTMAQRQTRAMVNAYSLRLDQAEAVLADWREQSLATGAHDPEAAFIGCFIPYTVASQIALAGHEVPSELHITLAYMRTVPEAASLDQVLSAFVQTCDPLVGTLTNTGRFLGVGDGGTDAFWMGVNIPGLTGVRQRLVAALQDAGCVVERATSYTPHVTLAYLNPHDPDPELAVDEVPVTCAHLTLGRGNARRHFRLGKAVLV